MPLKLDPLAFGKVLDVSDKFPVKLDRDLDFVKFEYLKGKTSIVYGRECFSNHYPVDDSLKGVLAPESELIEKLSNIREAQQINLQENIDSVLFKGIFESHAYGDIDWLKEANHTPLEMTLEEAEKYFKDLGYEHTHLYSKTFIEDCDWTAKRTKVSKVLLPKTAAAIISVNFSPANRFNTVNTVAKELYAFLYQNVQEDVIEIMAESNYLVVLEHPELVIHITN